MGVQRLNDIPGFNIDRVAAAAGDDPDVLHFSRICTHDRALTSRVGA
jgi:hypothetical protein